MKTSEPGKCRTTTECEENGHGCLRVRLTVREPPANTFGRLPVISLDDAIRNSNNMTVRIRMTCDYVRAFRGRLSGSGRCRVRLYEPEPGEDPSASTTPVVVCSEPADPTETLPGETSLADAAEYLAAEIMEDHRLAAGPPRWIEHRMAPLGEGESELWSSVVFAHYIPEEVLAPGGVRRKRIGRAERTSLDRQTVEALVGQSM